MRKAGVVKSHEVEAVPVVKPLGKTEKPTKFSEEVAVTIHNVNNKLGVLMHLVQLGDTAESLEIIRTIAAILKQTSKKASLHSYEAEEIKVTGLDQFWDWLTQHYGKAHNVKAETFLEGKVRIDLLVFQQVLDNLLSNSVKYGHPENVPVDIVCSMREGDFTIEVSDDGEGLPGTFHDLAHLGARGHQEVPGQGIGLHYCQKAIQSMGGMITGFKIQGRGTKIVMVLPVHR